MRTKGTKIMLAYVRFVLWLLVTADTLIADVSWKLTNNRVVIGKSINLTCTVHGIKTINPDVTRQWAIGKHGDIISYNGQRNNPSKYEEILSTGNTFGLKINNVTEEDLKMIYECRYGFNIFRNSLDGDKIEIIYSQTGDSTDNSGNTTETVVTFNVHFENTFPLHTCLTNYLNDTVLDFDVIIYRINESLIKAYITVKIPNTEEISKSNKEYNISCHTDDLDKMLTIKDNFTVYKDNFGSIEMIGAVVFVVVLTTVCHVCIAVVMKRKRQKMMKEAGFTKKGYVESADQYESVKMQESESV